ncbi:MAG TPA: hypothetical protein VK624_20430 [Steroidobacteraceae bacterium]|nr:hypothetical protein [Steroidobacteraceae bacterium]
MMPPATTVNPASPTRFHAAFTWLETALFSAVMSFAIAASAAFADELTSSRLLLVLLLLFMFQVMREPRLLITREFVLYSLLTAWLCVSELWTPDPLLGLNTIFPAVDFALIILMVASLIAWHDTRAVIVGALWGVLGCVALFAVLTGYPARVPTGFSYNAFATMYFYGLILALLYGWQSNSRILPLAIALLLLAHVAATTSIKTNFGIALGALGASLVYRRQFWRVLRRYIVYIALGAAVIAYVILSNEHLIERMHYGFERLGVGIQVLSAREDQQGYVGFNERRYWLEEGLRGWAYNPLFGHGVEAFRIPFGITSHSTPVDLLYNTGLIGFCLYYAIHASLAWRLLRSKADQGLRAIMLGCLIAYSFMTLSGTIYYLSTMAVYFGLCSSMLVPRTAPAEPR